MQRTWLPALAAFAACGKADPGPAAVPLDQIGVVHDPTLRTSPVGGAMDPTEQAIRDRLGETGYVVGEGTAVTSSYVLVDAENRSTSDAYVTLDGTLSGDGQKAPLKAESLFVPAGGIRTFLLLDDRLAPRPWATGVNVKVTGAMVARYRPAIEVSDLHVFTDGDHVVAAATVTSTAKRPGRGLVHCAFHDPAQKPIGRGHTILELEPGKAYTVRFVGPRGSSTADVFPGDATF